MYLANGVFVTKDPVRANDTMDIKYSGLLKNCGATGVLLHWGSDGWKGVRDEWMTREMDGDFRCSIQAPVAREINFCFKDTANNWDNNNGWNWRVGVM